MSLQMNIIDDKSFQMKDKCVRKLKKNKISKTQFAKSKEGSVGSSRASKKEEKRSNKRFSRYKPGRSEIWFDGVDEGLIRASMNNHNESNQKLVKETSFSGQTKIVAMDCEMVGVGDDGIQSVLARVSIVNYFGHCIYDKFVKPVEEVTDYRTHVSGVKPSDLTDAEDFKKVQKEVAEILKNRILVGHALNNDLQVLFLGHPKNMIRDTSKHFRYVFGNKKPSLKNLSDKLLGVKVQDGEHDSVQDAQAAMRLYTLHRKEWEAKIRKKKQKGNMKSKKIKQKVIGK